jgi:hypothetical protein
MVTERARVGKAFGVEVRLAREHRLRTSAAQTTEAELALDVAIRLPAHRAHAARLLAFVDSSELSRPRADG